MPTLDQFLSFFPDFLLKFLLAIVCGASFFPAIVLGIFSKRVGTVPAMAGMVTGIGFIGAGAIIQSRGTITGLTTAATIWVVAAIGLAIGAGFHEIAIAFTLLVLITLTLLGKIQHRLLGKCHYATCEIVHLDDGGRTESELHELFDEYDLPVETHIVSKHKGKVRWSLRYCDKHPAHYRFISDLWRSSGVREVKTKK